MHKNMINTYIELISIGLPFCVFKIVTGIHLQQHWLSVLGIFDLLINITNIVSLSLTKKRLLDACTFSYLVRFIKKPSEDTKYKWQDLGNAIDVLLSFTLVAYMIGWSEIVHIPQTQLTVWNISVVFNVFGAGYGRLRDSIKDLKRT